MAGIDPYYDDGQIVIYCADCRAETAWLAADVLVTDPPYGIGWKRSENKARSSKAHDGIANDHDTSARDDVLTMWGDKPAAVFGSFYAPYPAKLKQVLVWHKPADSGLVGSVTGYRRDAEPIFLTGPWPQRTVEGSSVLRTRGSMAALAASTGHPHTKPVGLLVELLTRLGEAVTVADPFMGSGSTLRAARDLGLRAIGVELEERWCEVAVKRLGQMSMGFGGVA